MLFIRSLAYNVAFYVLTAIGCVVLAAALPFSRHVLLAGVRVYMRMLVWLERRLLRLDYRVLGLEKVPPGPIIVAAKHQSTWETMKLHLLFPDAAVVLKSELRWIPLWGWFTVKAGMIAVDRGRGSRAVAGMVADARRAAAEGRPIVIFPQGTRTAPGTYRPYRIGVAALYEALGLPVVPLALNSGVFWGRREFVKRPGMVTLAFLDPIPPGLSREEFLPRLETVLEAESDRLVREAGGPATPPAIRYSERTANT